MFLDLCFHFKQDDFTLDEFETWLAYDAVTGNVSGARDDFRTSVLTSLVASFMGDKEATAKKYAWKFSFEKEHNEDAEIVNQKLYFTSLMRK